MEENRYKDALEKARIRYNEIKGTSSSEEKFLLDAFPDLVDSNDERIRKELIDAVQGLWDNDALPMPLSVRRKDEWLSWLIKQGETDKLIQELGKYKVKYTQEALEKHINSMNNKDDERLRKTTIAFLKDFADKGYENAVECIDWLEKQCEQNPVDKVEPLPIKAGNWYVCIKDYQFCEHDCLTFEKGKIYKSFRDNEVTAEDGSWWPFNDGSEFFRIATNEEVESMRKSFDKVVPKFHEGDWIVFNGLALYVNEIVDGFYRTISKGGITNSYDWNIDNAARLWSINDAKTGDVLAFKNNLCGIIICKSPTDYDTRSYCRLVNDNFISNEESGWDSKLLVPATKQQRDLLFEKMKDAGYTWDVIKGLKKIEFNPDELIAECYEQQADDLIDIVTKTTWKPTKEQLDAFTHFVRSVDESGHASPYDNNTKQLYSLLNDLKKLS